MKRSSTECENIFGLGQEDHGEQYSSHVKDCDSCRATEDLLGISKEVEEDQGALLPLNDLSARKLADSVLERYREEMSNQYSRGNLDLISKAAIGFAAAVVIGVSVWIFLPKPTGETGSEKALAETTLATRYINNSSFSLLSGEVFMGSTQARADGSVEEGSTLWTGNGRAIISLPNGIAISLLEETTMSIKEGDEHKLEVNFVKGSAFFVLDPEVKRSGFMVETKKGRIDVTGTVFTVEAASDSVKVHLHRGELIISEHGDSPINMSGPESIALGTDETFPVPKQARDQMLTLADQIHKLKLGEHLAALLVENEQKLKTDTVISRRPQEQSEQSTIISEEEPPAPEPDIRALMEEARTHKLNGNWQAAATIYEKIILNFASSNDAATSRVSLGQLNLEKLGQPKKALAHFSAYLGSNSSGPLAQEALYGRAKAFRSMNRKADELTALRELLSKYPNGVHAGIANKRISELEE